MLKRFMAATLFALIATVGAQAQTWTQMQWGLNKTGGFPYTLGLNVSGTWYPVGILSSSGAFTFAATITPPTALTLGGVFSSSATSNKYATGVDTSGNVVYSPITAASLPAFTGGDCTTSAGSVALNCTKTDGVAFSASATTDTTNASNILSGTLGSARGGAGAITGALKGNGSGVVTQAACADLSNAAASCSIDATNATNITSGTLPISVIPSSILSGAGAPGAVYATSPAGVSTGLSYTSKVAGSGGTNGTYNVTITAPAGGTNAVVQVVISGGAISGSPGVTTAGSNFTSVQTISNAQLVAAGATGLTGASVTLTNGGGVAFGSYFWVISASTTGVVDLYLNVAGVATAQNKTIADGGILSSLKIGIASPVSTGNVSTSNVTYMLSTPAAYNGFVSNASIYSNGAGAATIVVVSESGGTVTLISATQIILASGLNNLALHIPIATGQYVGIYSNTAGIVQYATTPSTVWYLTGKPATSTAYTVAGTITLEMNFTFQGQISGDVTYHDSAVPALQSSVGYLNAYGVTTAASGSGTSSAGTTYYSNAPATQSGFITQAQVASLTAQTGVLYVATDNGNGTLTATSQTSIALVAGNNIINNLSIPIAAGQIVGWSLPSGGLYYVLPSGSTLYHAGTPAIGVPIASSSTGAYYIQMGWTITSGLQQSVFNLQNSAAPDGSSVLATADNTGASDVTAAFTNARAAYPTPYVRSGVFSLTTDQNKLEGFYGVGTPKVNGVAFPLPRAPMSGTLWHRNRAALMGQINSGSMHVFIGDSISHGPYFATTKNDHFIDQYTRWINYGVAVDEPIMTALRASSPSYTPAFFGVTTSGTVTTGTAGPLAESAILASGAVYTFTGTYESLGIWYEQFVGAGTLTVARNGTTIATINANGASDHDKFSGLISTGTSSSATYTLTASVANVELTALGRFGVKVGGSPPRLYVMRAAHGSYTAANFGSTQITSILKIANALKTGSIGPSVNIELGTNESFASTYATNLASFNSLLTGLVAGGVRASDIRWMPTWRWGAGYTTGSYEATNAAIHDAVTSNGAKIIPTDGIDFVALGLTGDGVGHPNDAGNVNIFVLSATTIAGAP